MAERIYLDWNATAPLRPQARAAVADALGVCGNPSSVHAEGRAVRRRIEEARQSVAALVGAEPRNVVFTSGGTEANMMALSPFVGTPAGVEPRDCLLISAIEHPSVLAGGRFARDAVELVPVGPDGRLDLAALARALAALARNGRQRPLVSVMLANNETGVVQPVSQVAALAQAAGALLHVDAVQGAGRIPLDINELGADLLTLSGHKIGGPKGAGALVKRHQALHFTDPLIKGGGQERGARAGTENVACIVGFGAAAAELRLAFAAETARMAVLRDRLEAGLKARMPAAVVFGAQAHAASQYDPVRGPRHQGRDRRDRARSRRDRGVLGGGLLVRQGPALPCPGRHGGGAAARPRRHSGQPGADHDGIRDRSLSGCLDKAV